MTESNEERGLEARITPRLIDSLYTEAMLLADEARAYFDEAGRDDRQTLEPFARVGFACESLKVTTRIMHIVAWLLTQKAVESGEIKSADGRRPERRLGHANDSDPLVVDAAARGGAAADQFQRRPLFADPAARRGPADRRTGAKPGAGADGPAGTRPDLEPRRLTPLGSAPMRPFTFHPGPRLISGDGSAARLAELLPDGPCLFVTDKDVLAPRPDRCLPRGAGGRLGAKSSCSTRSRPIRRRKRCSPRSSWAGVMTSLMWSASAAAARWMSPSSPLTCSARAMSSTRSGASTSPRVSGCRWRWCRPRPEPAREATPISVITCEGGVKLAVNARPLMADWAVLDASLTLGLPAHVTAATGIDAIVHSVEAYTSARLKNPLSDALAREAFRLLTGNLLKAIEEPRNVEARSAMLLGAHLAGLAFANAPVAGVHALAYPLGGIHHLPHGLSNALMLRVVLQHNSEAARELYAELAPILAPGMRRAGEPGPLRGADRSARPAGRGQRVEAAAARPWHCRERHSDAGQGSDEADPAAGEQSLPDRGRGCAAALRGRLVSRPVPRGRDAYRWFMTIATRWADNDAYGHVNNTVYYQWFDTAVNAGWSRRGCSTSSAATRSAWWSKPAAPISRR